MYIRVCVCVCEWVYTHTHTHTHIYIYIYIYIYVLLYVFWNVDFGSRDDVRFFQNSTSVALPRHRQSFSEDIGSFLRQFVTFFFCNFKKFLSPFSLAPTLHYEAWKQVKGRSEYYRCESKKQQHRDNTQVLRIQMVFSVLINPLKPELNPICYLLALLGAHHFLHVSRIRIKLLTFRRLMSYIYEAPILDVSRSHTTT